MIRSSFYVQLRYKQKIRTLFLLGKFGSDFSGLVRVTGLEPAHRLTLDPKADTVVILREFTKS